MKLYVFSSKTCGPCKAMAPIIEKLKAKLPEGIDEIVQLDADDESDLADGMDILAVPAFVVVDRSAYRVTMGGMSAVALRKWIDAEVEGITDTTLRCKCDAPGVVKKGSRGHFVECDRCHEERTHRST
jgi:thiol-disulfide isomerase/thioredoxin